MAAVLSILFPGLGHLICGRPVAGIVWWIVCLMAYLVAIITFGIGLIFAIPLHIACIVHAATVDQQQQQRTIRNAISESHRRGR